MTIGQPKEAHINLHHQVEGAIRRLLSEQNRDICAPAYGCFDRRYWGWKLVDFPEATFQRNVYPLAWALKNRLDVFDYLRNDFEKAVAAGLQYAFQVQHRDGSFDQAFPNEHSYGATAFLVQPLLEAYKIIKGSLSEKERSFIDDGLFRASKFLCTKAETHDLISNHLAGAGLSLLVSGNYFNEGTFQQGGEAIINSILEKQDPEGWYPEYSGADPGYQTLCMYYLAQVYKLRPDPVLKSSLDRSLNFLSWFIHPDGSFGGEYGSRRTAVYYPGGIALLAEEFPTAAAMSAKMLESMARGSTVTLQDIDFGNMAPLLQNSILTLDAYSEKSDFKKSILPIENDDAAIDFSSAGLSIRGNKKYYSVTGLSNGGVIKVFDKSTARKIYDDSGYYARLNDGRFLSTQMTNSTRMINYSKEKINFSSPFYLVLRSIPTPFQFTLLRIANITVMRSIWLGNLIKKILVNLLIKGETRFPMQVERTLWFKNDSVEIIDQITMDSKLNITSLDGGIPFSSIHMASARYFQGQSNITKFENPPIDIDLLKKIGKITRRVEI